MMRNRLVTLFIYLSIFGLLFSTSSSVLLSVFDPNVVTTASTTSKMNSHSSAEGASRSLLNHRVFEARGQTGLPFLDPVTGAFIDPAMNPAQTTALINYAQDVGLPSLAGILVAVICLFVSCCIWYGRCCCNCCCTGDPDPESKHVPVRIIVAILSFLGFCGAIIGLVGGVVMSNAIRDFMTQAIAIGNNLAINLATLQTIGQSIGVTSGTLTSIDGVVTTANGLLRSVNLVITPFDVARMFILYIGMALAMLAGVTLGVGVVLRRKQITSTGFVCTAIALVVAWFIFGINLPMAILLDDACVTAEGLFTQQSMGGSAAFLLQCTDTQTSHDGIEAIVAFADMVYAQIGNQAGQINGNAPNTYSGTITGWDANTLRGACPQSGMFWTRTDALCIAARVRADHDLVLPQYRACDMLGMGCWMVPGPPAGQASHNAIDFAIGQMDNVATGMDAVNVLIDCATINSLLDLFRTNICNTLIVGILLVFVGALIIGIPLIPAVLAALWVAQKFPNRAAAARLKSRLMVIFAFQFFHAIVAVAGELRPDTAEVVLSALTIVIGALGFAFLNIPMNRLNWSPTAQMWLSAVLAVMELGLAGGWIYLLLRQAALAEGCINVVFQQSLQMGMFVFPTASTNSPCWDNAYFSHVLLSTVLSATSTLMCVLGAVTAIILLVKIKCGYSLNLDDSDYELD